MSTLEILDKDTSRTNGENVRKFNVHAMRLIKGLIQSFLGPKGQSKIYIDIIGEATFTKCGATFLRKIDVQHPAAKVLIDASNSVDNEVGDGTITVAIITASLLEKAEEMLSLGISAPAISFGYSMGLEHSLEILQKISKKIDKNDFKVIQKIVKNFMATKTLYNLDDGSSNEIHMDDIVLNAIRTVYSNNNGFLDIDNIKIEEKIGYILESKLINGIVIDKSLDNDQIPKYKENAKILLLDDDLDSKNLRRDALISISDPSTIHLFLAEENRLIKDKVQHIIDSGADVVFCRKGIGLKAQEYLSKAGIMSVKRVKENDLHWLEKSTGGKLVKEITSEIIKNNLGLAGKVYEKRISDDKMVFVEDCMLSKAVTILIRGCSKMILDECHRSIIKCLTVVKNFIQNPYVVIGGGSCEALLAYHIKKRALTKNGQEQIAMIKFAEALEEIPLTLAKNSGMNELDCLTHLRNRVFNNNSYKKIQWVGVDIEKKIIGTLNGDLIEPVFIKEQVLNTATEVSRLLINVDDIIMKKPLMNTHTHEDGTVHSHAGGEEKHDHYFDKLGKQQRPHHHYY